MSNILIADVVDVYHEGKKMDTGIVAEVVPPRKGGYDFTTYIVYGKNTWQVTRDDIERHWGRGFFRLVEKEIQLVSNSIKA